MGNPRYANGQLRRKHRARLRAMGCECGICHGRFGYPSARAAAEDWSNLQAAHWFCNAQKGNKTAENGPKQAKIVRIPHVSDGSW